MTDEELRLTDRYKVELENAIYYYRPRTDRETKLIELLILEKIRAIKELEKENAELKEQVEDWKADHEHNLELMKGLNGKIAELEMQNEKMKCCGNCSNSSDTKITVCDKWELAE